MMQSAAANGGDDTPAARLPGADGAADAVSDAAGRAEARAGVRRFRGRNKASAWRRPDAVTVVRLRLTPDPAARCLLERLFSAAWSLKRAVRRDARSRAISYRAGRGRRSQDEAAAWRHRLGLSREGMERAAYRHLDASGHLKHHLSKAVAMHLADEVWAGLERHLFPDASGRRQGLPRVGSWWEFGRIPGRARSHTTARKWETFRLHGTLAGHLTAHAAPGLSEDLSGGLSPRSAAGLPPGTSVLASRE